MNKSLFNKYTKAVKGLLNEYCASDFPIQELMDMMELGWGVRNNQWYRCERCKQYKPGKPRRKERRYETNIEFREVSVWVAKFCKECSSV